MSAKVHVAPPEGAEQLALDADVLDVLGIGRLRNRRNLLIRDDRDHSAAAAIVILRGLL